MQELGRVGEVGFRDAEDGTDARVECGDQVAVDEAFPGLGIGSGDDDEHLVGVGDDHSLDLVGVIGAAAEERRTFDDPHDPREGALVSGEVADDANPVAVDDGVLAEFSTRGKR